MYSRAFQIEINNKFLTVQNVAKFGYYRLTKLTKSLMLKGMAVKHVVAGFIVG
jgi:hypothetical protein